ncbi:hypothetical protein T12_8898 [Trichinella patagoniensis]|uniref:Uncharacterized protein n=1 Tax=Trichinella patagoniensis TaxID=990121 RepID=A0A0V0YQG7_9BILA|nr:hypothetical protein T12_8898 [Trichinella patagoniensis]
MVLPAKVAQLATCPTRKAVAALPTASLRNGFCSCCGGDFSC